MQFPKQHRPGLDRAAKLLEEAVDNRVIHLPVQDVDVGSFYFLESSAVTASSIAGASHHIREAHAIGFHGFCPPGALLLVAPERAAQQVANELSSTWWMRFASYNTRRVWSNIAELVLMRPGDVLNFGQPFTGKLILQPLIPFANGGYTAGAAITLSTNGTNFTPRARVRLFTGAGELPANIRYSPVPWFAQTRTIGGSAPTGEPTALSDNGTFWLPQGTTHVTVQIQDDAATARVQGAETGDFEVWWFLSSGLWAHNGADDFDAAGRGQASASHDVEVYPVPHNAVGVALVKTAGATTLWANVLASEV